MHSQITGEFSSVGLEHLPYKQRVGGSNPSTPTLIKAQSQDGAFFVSGRFEFTQKRTEMKKAAPERSEGVLLSTARRDNGISNPSTPTLIKAQSQDGAFFVLGLFEFTQIRTKMKKVALSVAKECFYPLHVGTTGSVIPQLPL